MDVRKQRIRLALVVAIGAASAYAYGPSIIQGAHFWSDGESETVPVLVAKQYISSFLVVKPDMVEMKKFPRSFVPPGALTSMTELQNDQGQNVYATVVGIPEEQPLTRTILIEANQQQRLSSLLRMGRVAVSFEVDKSKSAGGWVKPGDTIAIFQALPLPTGIGPEGRKATKLLFSALQVLAVDAVRVGQSPAEERDESKSALMADVSPDSMQCHVVTVLATPAEAASLIEAREKGALCIVLRAMGDDIPWVGDPSLAKGSQG